MKIWIAIALFALVLTCCVRLRADLPMPGGEIRTPANDDLERFGTANTLGFKTLRSFPKGESYVADLVLHDLDGDKKDEILVRYSSGSLCALDAAGAVRWKAQPGPVMNSQARILVLDADGDGKPEILTGGEKHLALLDAAGNVRFTLPTDDSQCNGLHPLGGSPPVIGMEGSLMSDLKTVKHRVELGPKPSITRLEHSDALAQRIAALPASSDARQAAHEACANPGLTIGAHTWHFNGSVLATADLDGDGQPETIATAQRRSTAVVPTHLVIFGPTGDVVFHHQYPSWLGGLAVGDLDGDGVKELVSAGHYTEPFTVVGRPSGGPPRGSDSPRPALPR